MCYTDAAIKIAVCGNTLFWYRKPPTKEPRVMQLSNVNPRTASVSGSRDLVSVSRDLVLRPPKLQPDRTIFARTGLSGCVPPSEGVYLFHDLRGVLYVGRSTNLRRRFVQHLELDQNPWLTVALSSPVLEMRFSWILVASGQSEPLERDLIHTFRPPCNRTSLWDRRRESHGAVYRSRICTAAATIAKREEAMGKR